jgi:hypothetical protein
MNTLEIKQEKNELISKVVFDAIIQNKIEDVEYLNENFKNLNKIMQ